MDTDTVGIPMIAVDPDTERHLGRTRELDRAIQTGAVIALTQNRGISMLERVVPGVVKIGRDCLIVQGRTNIISQGDERGCQRRLRSLLCHDACHYRSCRRKDAPPLHGCMGALRLAIPVRPRCHCCASCIQLFR